MKMIYKNKIIILFFFTLLIWPNISKGAELFFETKSQEIGVGDSVLINFYVDTKNESINAIGGKVQLPISLLLVEEVRDGDSFINLWINRPKISEKDIIDFSGIFPGGIKSNKVFLFSILAKSVNEGTGLISIKEIEVLKNDGQGTRAVSNSVPMKVVISGPKVGKEDENKIIDNTPPEDFKIEVGQTPGIFEGKNFIAFSTTDKGVGIDHYEIKEGLWGKYIKGDSPYLLLDQSLNKSVYVKAFDKSGNERVVKLEVESNKFTYLWLPLFCIIILCLFAFRFFSKKHG